MDRSDRHESVRAEGTREASRAEAEYRRAYDAWMDSQERFQKARQLLYKAEVAKHDAWDRLLRAAEKLPQEVHDRLCKEHSPEKAPWQED